MQYIQYQQHSCVFFLFYFKGNRTFGKILICNWTSGYRWSTAALLSLTLGGFGVDRFYLGYWKEGLAKLFSFGGLGVWTLVDFILILAQYVGPSDGSLYIF
ncbi:TM2 domain-containing 3 [Paramuricea clavata]|uniref:TM2 domain-containing 3 n=1 Tax=Paramuricea clavata TaxID=317549 RepID=A0A6S7GMF4_PARCT|nr:TM2 domain-containing 3 [Paramuricea clavata]